VRWWAVESAHVEGELAALDTAVSELEYRDAANRDEERDAHRADHDPNCQTRRTCTVS
jgi:hypothetical protein